MLLEIVERITYHKISSVYMRKIKISGAKQKITPKTVASNLYSIIIKWK